MVVNFYDAHMFLNYYQRQGIKYNKIVQLFDVIKSAN